LQLHATRKLLKIENFFTEYGWGGDMQCIGCIFSSKSEAMARRVSGTDKPLRRRPGGDPVDGRLRLARDSSLTAPLCSQDLETSIGGRTQRPLLINVLA
jgi:hypothetical protein